MANQAAQTAYGPMVVVAVEQFSPPEQRLVHDALAFQFLPPGVRLIVKLTRWNPVRKWLFEVSERQARGVWAGVLCRKRYIDEKLTAALQTGMDALVVLGAGLDTHACRLHPPLTAFEVDLPENSAYKKARLQQFYGRVPDHLHLVPLDFDSGDLFGALASQGYHSESKSFFIWEAVTQYLSEAGVRKTFDFLANAGAGSQLVFTYVRKDFIDGIALDGLDTLYQTYRVKRPIWHFGFDPAEIATFLASYGWKELEQVGGEECRQRYLQPAARTWPVMEIERCVYAEKL